VHEGKGWEKRAWKEELEEGELQEVLMGHKSMGKGFEEVKNWQDYGASSFPPPARFFRSLTRPQLEPASSPIRTGHTAAARLISSDSKKWARAERSFGGSS
jgi:hypothetical protein